VKEDIAAADRIEDTGVEDGTAPPISILKSGFE